MIPGRRRPAVFWKGFAFSGSRSLCAVSGSSRSVFHRLFPLSKSSGATWSPGFRMRRRSCCSVKVIFFAGFMKTSHLISSGLFCQALVPWSCQKAWRRFRAVGFSEPIGQSGSCTWGDARHTQDTSGSNPSPLLSRIRSTGLQRNTATLISHGFRHEKNFMNWSRRQDPGTTPRYALS